MQEHPTPPPAATEAPAPPDQQPQAAPEAQPTLQQELTAANDKYVRLYAEFENFRRRTAQEKATLISTAGEDLLKKLLPIVDDFERALAALPAADAATQQGIQLIYDKLVQLLQQAHVQPMTVTQGTPLDTALHEAIAQAPTQDPTLQGRIIDITEKGYLLNDKVLRFAKVVIGK